MIPVSAVSGYFSGIEQSGKSGLKEPAAPEKSPGGFQEFLERAGRKEPPADGPEKVSQKDPAGEKLSEKTESRKKPDEAGTDAGKETGKEGGEAVAEKPVAEKPAAKKEARAEQPGIQEKTVKKILPETQKRSAEKKVSSSVDEQETLLLNAGQMVRRDGTKPENISEDLPKTALAREEGGAVRKQAESSGQAPAPGKSETAVLQVVDLRKAARPVEGKGEAEEKKSVKPARSESGRDAEKSEGPVKRGTMPSTDAQRAFEQAEQRAERVSPVSSGAEEKSDSGTIHVQLTSASGPREGQAEGVPRSAPEQLSHQLREELSSKIVKQASIIVKSEKSGEIRLILHPEHLGRVRIRLQLEDNRIAGRIFVDNTSVREAFEANLKNLERAFQQDGFDSAKLDVFVGGREQDRNRADGEKRPGLFIGPERSTAVERLETSVPLMERYYSGGDTLIDLVV